MTIPYGAAWSVKLLRIGAAFAILGIVVAAASAIDPFAARLGPFLPPGTACAGASLIVAADALLCAGLTAVASRRAAAWSQPGLNAGLALLAGACCVLAWRGTYGPIPDPTICFVAGGALLAVAFPALVLERTFSALGVRDLPDAQDLAAVLRVPLVALLGIGICDLLIGTGLEWPVWVMRAIGALIVLVSIELCCAALRPFSCHPADRPRSIARSVVARAIRPAVPSIRLLGTAIERQVGIDLQRSWAIGFAARAALPICVRNHFRSVGDHRSDRAAHGRAGRL